MERHHLAAVVRSPDYLEAAREAQDNVLPLGAAAASAAAHIAAVPPSAETFHEVMEGRPQSLAALLRDLRFERNLTLADIADAVGVSRPTVWAWEAGKARPTREKWAPLAEVLGVVPQVLAAAIKTERNGPRGAVASRYKDDRAALIAAGRQIIAEAYNVDPSAVRITLEV